MENIQERLTLEEVKTFRSKKGREVIGLVTGHLGDNKRGTSLLVFPDPDHSEDPLWWYMGEKQERDTRYNSKAEITMMGSLVFSKSHAIKVELDYEGGHTAQRLKIISAEGVAFFSEYEGVVPKWIQA